MVAKTSLVLSRYRDPWTPWTGIHKERASWIAGWFEQMGRQTHLRGFHYWLQSLGNAVKPDGTTYSNTEEDWNLLQDWSRWARYLNEGDWSNLIDLKHPDSTIYLEDDYQEPGSIISTYSDVQDLIDRKIRFLVPEIINELALTAPHYNDSGYQKYLLFVLCEKNTMNQILSPILARYKGVLQPLVGEASVERCEQVIRLVSQRRKPARVFYISDFDPSGECMPMSVARKLEFFAREKYGLEERGLDVKLRPIVLTREQVSAYNLPGSPTKSGDKKARGFIDRYGNSATELDALEALYPGELAQIVRDTLEPYFNQEAPDIIEEENEAVSNRVMEILEPVSEKLTEILSAIKVDDLETVDLHLALNPDFIPPDDDFYVDDSNDNWLLDTGLNYDEQLDIYNQWKNGKQ